jgi:hypothetical protein
MSRRLRARPLDPIIDFSLTGCDRSFAGAELCRSFDLRLPGKMFQRQRADWTSCTS